ncbi:MAG: hypothetical protein K2F99_06210, partial [Muribaculaceae bacterium]|nr:hypothetical protein [Muribaculaceae bacterium]
MLMIAEIFSTLASAATQNVDGKLMRMINLNNKKIRSISSFSSNSIFYFNCIAVDQVMPEEVMMVSRMLEKSYASFVVACISLMPFHRVRADDRAAIEDYLKQFHQNVGINGPNNFASKALGMATHGM